MLSAILHDLGRDDDRIEQSHGATAAHQYAMLIQRVLKTPTMRASCQNAVIMHSEEDDKCPLEKQDATWKILKDADALERGRFAYPPDSEKGCHLSKLRLREIESIRSNLAWLAYWLPGTQRNSNAHAETAARQLVEDIYRGLNAVVQMDLMTGSREADLAKEIVQRIQAFVQPCHE